MNRTKKSVAALLISGGAIGAWFGGQTLVREMAFAQQQQEVQTTHEQLKTVEDMATAFRNVGKAVEPSVVRIDVRKTIKGSARGALPDDMLRRFFRDRLPDGQGDDNGNNNDDNNNDAGPDDGLGGGFEQVGTGSGVIMEVDGKTAYILTNNHVAGGATEMIVTLADGRKIENAKLVGADPKSD